MHTHTNTHTHECTHTQILPYLYRGTQKHYSHKHTLMHTNLYIIKPTNVIKHMNTEAQAQKHTSKHNAKHTHRHTQTHTNTQTNANTNTHTHTQTYTHSHTKNTYEQKNKHIHFHSIIT